MRDLIRGWLAIGVAALLLVIFTWMVEQAEPVIVVPDPVAEVTGEAVEPLPEELLEEPAPVGEIGEEVNGPPTVEAEVASAPEPTEIAPDPVPSPPAEEPDPPVTMIEASVDVPEEAVPAEAEPAPLPELCPLLEVVRSYATPEIGEGMMVTPLEDTSVRTVCAGEVLEVTRGSEGSVTVYLAVEDGTHVLTYAGLTAVFCAVGQNLPCGSEIGEQPAEQPFRFSVGRRTGEDWWSLEPVDVAPFLGLGAD